MEVSGAVVARVTLFPDGKAMSSCADYPLTGKWKCEKQILSMTDVDGEVTARFNAEGLDDKGRKLLWGSVKAGAVWLRHSLREVPPPVYYPSLSLCVSCKGRLHHLRETLPRNLMDNSDYPNLEFVVLDYNSTDGLSGWMEREMRSYIDNGRLRYFRTEQPKFFNISHAKNLSLRLATGDVLGVVDADNFTGKGYAYYIADNIQPNICLVGCRMEDNQFQPADDEGCVGRFALHREAFYEIGGMDEELIGWGYEDIDLYTRLMQMGYRCQSMPHQYTTCLPHTDAERSKELEFPETGRGSDSEGTCFINSVRSKANLSAGKIVCNDGRFGCGSVRNHDNETLVVRERRDPALSLCIVCRDEVHSLQRALPQNLRSMRFYPNLEVIVLSPHNRGLESWLKDDFGEEVKSGRLVHCQLEEPSRKNNAGSLTHLKNLCMRLASGDILCSASPECVFDRKFTTHLARRCHEQWIQSEVEKDYFLIARHLFHLARGLREDLPEELAPADLHERLERRWAPDSDRQSIADGTSLDFGVGTLRRGADTVVLHRHRFPRVSFIIPCFGDPDDLKKTLPRNLLDNRYYPNLEFVVLDCSGNGDLSRWIKSELGGHMASKRLVYSRHRPGEGVRPGLAKNIAMRSSTGEYLCNVDADSLTARDFAFYVADRLQESDFLSGCLYFGDHVDSCHDQSTAGRIAFSRQVFDRVGGFDEQIAESGRGNLELLERLEALKLRGASIDGRFLRTIPFREGSRRNALSLA